MDITLNHFATQSKTQRDEILAALRSKPKVPAYELAAIALQYSARIFELRKAGYKIRNETKRVGGQTHSTFELVSEPEPFKLTPQKAEPTPVLIVPVRSSTMLDFECGRRVR